MTYVSTKYAGGIKMNRKEMIKLLGESFGIYSKYLSTQSFACEIRTTNGVCTIDCNRCITKRDVEPVTMEEIFSQGSAKVMETLIAAFTF